MKARKTSLSLGSWEYLWVPRETRGEGLDQGRTWIPHTHMVEGGWEVGDLHKVQIESEMPYSFREYLRQANNARTRYSIGRAEIAVSGNKDDPQTERLLGTLVDTFFEYADLHKDGRPSHESATWNAIELPRGPAYTGDTWDPNDPDCTLYLGEMETVKLADEGEEGEEGAERLTKSGCIGLDAREGEKGDAHTRVSYTEFMQFVRQEGTQSTTLEP